MDTRLVAEWATLVKLSYLLTLILTHQCWSLYWFRLREHWTLRESDDLRGCYVFCYKTSLAMPCLFATCNNLICCKTGLKVGGWGWGVWGKTRNTALQLVLQQCLCFVARFTVSYEENIKHTNYPSLISKRPMWRDGLVVTLTDERRL